MRKLTSLKQMLEAYAPKDKITVFTDEGTQTKSQPKGLPFKLKYRAIVQINEFTGDPNLVFAAVGRWITQNEFRTADDNFFKFDVAFVRETEAFVEMEIDLEENISVVENENGELIVNAC